MLIVSLHEIIGSTRWTSSLVYYLLFSYQPIQALQTVNEIALFSSSPARRRPMYGSAVYAQYSEDTGGVETSYTGSIMENMINLIL